MTYENLNQNINSGENIFSKNDKINLEKDNVYLNNVAKIGNSVQNIKIINNVLSKEDHEKLLDFTKNISLDTWISQPWGVDIFYSSTMSDEIIEILNKVFEIALKTSIDVYDVGINTFDKGSVHLNKWRPGISMPPHIDTLSQRSDHIAALYYINDDYQGGEINFVDHNFKIKPKSNSLTIFPGNENYLHEVLEVSEGIRYTSSIWFQFAGSTFLGKVQR